MAESFPCSVAGLMAVPLSLVSHEARAYAQTPLANHNLERERPSTDQAAALSDRHSLNGTRTRQVELQAETLHPWQYATRGYFNGSPGLLRSFMGSRPKKAAAKKGP